MELTRYISTSLDNRETLKDITRYLSEGYDVFPLFSSAWTSTMYKYMIENNYPAEYVEEYIEDYSLIYQQQFWVKEKFCFYLFNDIVPAGLDIRRGAELSIEQLEEVANGTGIVDTTIYAKPEFNAKQMRQIRLGLEEGLDVSWYAKPEFSAEQMEEIRTGLKQGIDVSIYAKPEYSKYRMKMIRYLLRENLNPSTELPDIYDMPDSLLKHIITAYNIYGSITVDIFKNENHSKFYSKLAELGVKAEKEENIETTKLYNYAFSVFIMGQILNVFNPEQYQELVEKLDAETTDAVDSLVKQTFESIKKKLTEMFFQDMKAKDIDYQCCEHIINRAVEKLQLMKLDYDNLSMLTQITELAIKNKYLWQFFLMMSREDRMLFWEGVSVLKQAGITPDEYISGIKDFKSKDILNAINKALIYGLTDMGVAVTKSNIMYDSELLDFYCLCKDAYKKNIKLNMIIKSRDAAVKAQIVIKYLQKGIDVSKHVPSMGKILRANNKIKHSFDYIKYISTYDTLSYILLRHSLNLFSEITDTLMKVKDNRAGAVADTVKYLKVFLDKAQTEKGHKQQVYQKCSEMLIEQIRQGNCFDAGQIRQLYYGVLHGVDVSKYIHPDYSAEVMSAIREGLEKGVDLSPHAQSMSSADKKVEGARMWHLLRVFTGMTPQKATDNIHLQKTFNSQH